MEMKDFKISLQTIWFDLVCRNYLTTMSGHLNPMSIFFLQFECIYYPAFGQKMLNGSTHGAPYRGHGHISLFGEGEGKRRYENRNTPPPPTTKTENANKTAYSVDADQIAHRAVCFGSTLYTDRICLNIY